MILDHLLVGREEKWVSVQRRKKEMERCVYVNLTVIFDLVFLGGS